MPIQIHETAIIDKGAQIGEGSRVWHWAHVCGSAKIGKGVSLGQNVFVGNKVIIGNQCKVQNNVSIYDNITLEEGVFCGPSMVFTNVYNPRALVERKNEYKDTLVKKGSTLGANCTIVCGITIGEFAFIGAGANSPMVIPQTIVQFAPRVDPFFTSVSLYSFFLSTKARGLYTLVNTMLGPQNTPSSSVILS
jgi:serine acetyltransferase